MNKWEKELAALDLKGERAVLDEMQGHYQTALDRVNHRIAELAERDDLPGIRQRKYQEMLSEQIGGALDELRSGTHATLEGYLSGVYEDGFLGSLYNLQKQGIPLAFPIDQAAAARAVSMTAGDIKLSKRIYSNVDTLQHQVIAEITRGFADAEHVVNVARGIATETSIEDAIKRNVKGRTDQAFRRAMTIARTEKGRVQASSTLDAMRKAKSKGADVVKQWDSTMDARTRPDHIAADGQIRELAEPFNVGGCKGLAPHLLGRPEQDVNCRCVCLQRARTALEWDDKSTKWDGVNKCYVDLSDSNNYLEFKARCNNLTRPVKEKPAVGAVSKPSFTPSSTIDDAEAYSMRFIGDGFSPKFKNQSVLKGISVDNANEINRALTGLFDSGEMPKLNGIKAISAKSAQGKKVFSSSDAVAAYNPVEHGIYLNKDVLKSAKAVSEYNEKAKEAWDYVTKNIARLSGKQKEIAMLYKDAGRSLVGDGSVHDYIVHEMGHHVEWSVLDVVTHNAMGKTRKRYAPGISGYANTSTSEYIAESFSAYVKGELDSLDPEFVVYLRAHGLRPAGNTVSASNETKAVLRGTGVIKTLKLSKKEYAHVQSEIRTNLNDRQKDMPVVTKAIGDYIYTFENNWPDDARIIGRVKIDDMIADEIDEVRRGKSSY